MLRANTRISPLQAVLCCHDLVQLEDQFRTAKALRRTGPLYHSSDAVIRGHVFCSCLALVLRKELGERCPMAGSDLDGATCYCVQEVEISTHRSPFAHQQQV